MLNYNVFLKVLRLYCIKSYFMNKMFKNLGKLKYVSNKSFKNIEIKDLVNGINSLDSHIIYKKENYFKVYDRNVTMRVEK